MAGRSRRGAVSPVITVLRPFGWRGADANVSTASTFALGRGETEPLALTSSDDDGRGGDMSLAEPAASRQGWPAARARQEAGQGGRKCTSRHAMPQCKWPRVLSAYAARAERVSEGSHLQVYGVQVFLTIILHNSHNAPRVPTTHQLVCL